MTTETKEQIQRLYEYYKRATLDHDLELMQYIANCALKDLSAPHAQLNYKFSYWGMCPVCAQREMTEEDFAETEEKGGFLYEGREIWWVCEKHKTKWWVGSNLFSSWRDMTEQELAEQAAMLKDYKEVLPMDLIEITPTPAEKEEADLMPF